MQPPAQRRISIVLPTYDEEANVVALHARLAAVAERRPDLRLEFVFVDDASRDRTRELLLDLRRADPRVGVVGLARNCGHQVAITAGLDACAGADAVVVMDSDLQDPPEVVLELIEVWEAGADVVYAQRRTRQDSRLKRGTAWLYYLLLSRLADVDIPRDVGDFRLLDARVVAEVARYREHDRYLRGIVAAVGFRQEAVLFDREPRVGGTTGYTWRRMVALATAGLLGFSTAPLRMISALGVAVSLFSALLALYVLQVRLLQPEQSVPGWAFLGVGMFFLGGIQLLVMGVIGSYVGRIYVEAQDRPLYAVSLTARDAEPARVETATAPGAVGPLSPGPGRPGPPPGPGAGPHAGPRPWRHAPTG